MECKEVQQTTKCEEVQKTMKSEEVQQTVHNEEIQQISGYVQQTMICGKVEMPSLAMGTWEGINEAELEIALDEAILAGYRHIDTGHVFNNEKLIGEVLERWIRIGKVTREKLFITTKLPLKFYEKKNVAKYVKESLKNLKLSYIDLYLIQFPLGTLPLPNGYRFKSLDIEGIWQKLEEQVTAGLIREIGVSNFTEKQIERILNIAKIKPACNQIEVHVYLQQPALVSFCQGNDILVSALCPLGNPSHNKYREELGLPFLPDFNNVLEDPVVSAISKKHNKTNAQVALRFLLQKNISIIIKTAKKRRIIEDTDIFSFSLDDQDMEKLESLDKGESARIVDWGKFYGIKHHPEYPFPPSDPSKEKKIYENLEDELENLYI